MQGGMYDQLGGGFHRYSVDERWFATHFEKMLYDNALLCRTYLEAFQLTGEPRYREIVEETLSYVQTTMTHPEGGFYSAEDADSEGEEGRFYTWTEEELVATLGRDSARLAAAVYGTETGGNWEGTNILCRHESLESLSKRLAEPKESLSRRIDEVRQALFAQRCNRVRPGLDDKVLASWNGLMLTALCEASFVLENPQLLETALCNAEFLTREMIRDGRLMRTWRSGRAKLSGYLEDYAHVVEAFLALFQITGESRWLAKAEELTQTQIDLFYDREAGDFYFTAGDGEELLLRPKEHYDNATPSGNSTTSINLLQLGNLTGNSDYVEMAGRMLARMTDTLSRYPSAFSNWLKALDFQLGPVTEIAILGPAAGRHPLEEVVRSSFLPRKVLIRGESVAGFSPLPVLEGKQVAPGQAIAFVCEDYSCKEPVSDPTRLREQLGLGPEKPW